MPVIFPHGQRRRGPKYRNNFGIVKAFSVLKENGRLLASLMSRSGAEAYAAKSGGKVVKVIMKQDK